MNYYKATQPDGRDFVTGTIDYGAALVSGEVIRHPSKRKVRDDASTYLSVSVSPSDCTGFSWPCRLFRVEPVGRIMANLSVSPNKRAVSALRVVEELPSWQTFGPNGEAVVTFIGGCAAMTKDDCRKVGAARYAARYAAWNAARDAARYAAWAIVVRDLITAEQYDTLTQAFVDAGFVGMVGR